MLLEGSCHCGGVRFKLRSAHPYPFNLCYCSICRKTSGGGGYAINLGGDYSSLEVEGEGNIGVYRAKIHNEETGKREKSQAQRHFLQVVRQCALGMGPSLAGVGACACIGH